MSSADKCNDVVGLTEHVAMEYLLHAAREVPPGQAIVELGVYQGASLACLAAGALAGRPVFGIDPWGVAGAYPGRPHMLKRYPAQGMNITRKHLEACGVTDKVTLIRGFGVTEGENWLGPEVGLLFIDAVHRELDVLADFRAWAPHLAPEALVCFDDHDERFDGVRRAVQVLVDQGSLKWVEMVGSRLAVLRRP